MKEMIFVLAKRFFRTFVAGFVGALSSFVAGTQTLETLKEPGAWTLAAVMAGIAGGLAAIDKALRWQE